MGNVASEQLVIAVKYGSIQACVVRPGCRFAVLDPDVQEQQQSSVYFSVRLGPASLSVSF